MCKSLRLALVSLSLALLSTLALADPSSRVGRLSALEGQVSFRSNSQAGAEAVGLNWPVTTLNQISTSRNGHAEFRVGSSVVQINGDSELEVVALEDDEFRLRLNYGSIVLNIKNPDVVRDLSVATPHGILRLNQPSRLRLDTEVMPDITAAAVISGAAQFDSASVNLKIAAGKRFEINDSSTRQVAARFDGFDDWSAARERLADSRSESVRYVSAETTGYEELDRYGDWRVADEFGPVWAPRNVASDWAPYRDGRWTWIEPWGWTWIDNAPWGYAPSHYGRWVTIDARWYWVPGRVTARPVWAPAVVGWVGGANWSMSVGGRSGPGVGWFPLAPREVYVPAYRVSPAYVERINHAYGMNMQPQQQYRNARVALTVVPQAQFTARSNVVVQGGMQQAVHQDHAPRPGYEAQINGRSNAPQDSRNWSRPQERPMPATVAAPPLQSQPQAQAPVPLQMQGQGTPQALPSSRMAPANPVMQQVTLPPAQQPVPPLQTMPQPQPQPHSASRVQPPPMQQPVGQPVQRNPEPVREAHEYVRAQPQQPSVQQPQPQSAQPAAQQQGSSRERERERAAGRQERRQPGEHEPGNTGR